MENVLLISPLGCAVSNRVPKLESQERGEMEDRVQSVISKLSEEGIAGLEEYEGRLRANAGKEKVFIDFLFEAYAALMFSRSGFKVIIQERPDLLIYWNDEPVYAEVKHFREKGQDGIDEQAMRRNEDLVPTGILTSAEGSEAWKQIAEVAIGKVNQYKEDSPNILVIATDSNSIDGSILRTAVDFYNGQADRDTRLRKLNAFMLIDQWYRWIEELSVEKNVYFRQTADAKTPMSVRLVNALESIERW
jgi:hypothetical protein